VKLYYLVKTKVKNISLNLVVSPFGETKHFNNSDSVRKPLNKLQTNNSLFLSGLIYPEKMKSGVFIGGFRSLKSSFRGHF